MAPAPSGPIPQLSIAKMPAPPAEIVPSPRPLVSTAKQRDHPRGARMSPHPFRPPRPRRYGVRSAFHLLQELPKLARYIWLLPHVRPYPSASNHPPCWKPWRPLAPPTSSTTGQPHPATPIPATSSAMARKADCRPHYDRNHACRRSCLYSLRHHLIVATTRAPEKFEHLLSSSKRSNSPTSASSLTSRSRTPRRSPRRPGLCCCGRRCRAVGHEAVESLPFLSRREAGTSGRAAGVPGFLEVMEDAEVGDWTSFDET